MRNKKLSIYDIADELNLAPSTISKAINGTGAISEKTRKRVIEYIKGRGYTPITNSKGLKEHFGYTVGVLLPTRRPDVFQHNVFSNLVEMVRRNFESSGIEFTYVSHFLGNHKVSYLEYCRNRHIDGVVIFASKNTDEDILEVINSGIPCVSWDYVNENVSFVKTDDKMAANLVANFAVKHDYKKITYVSGPNNIGDFDKRTREFVDYVNKKGLDLDIDVINSNNADIDSSRYCVGKYLDEKEKPELMICGNDEIAMGAVYGIMDHNYKVPEDIGVIGFDDIYFAKYFNPPLTTISQDYVALAYYLTNTLIEQIETPNSTPKHQYIACELVERKSTK